ncbi:ATP-binding protein [Leifsonia virtsii]|uniref:ATP-binding protein n=1 Tax=Leifsonia virtsii TaxID=3035915 RepID=A0ABT8IXQ0_9MICO|nr:ATP-binding protein [Leifsonia virtsii]MDN4597580.1 ATP-binding protein [Leifsonia virtsii]
MKASGLAKAHRGYQYQDLIAALALVDALLQRTVDTIIDRKLFAGDLFDDLTITSSSGRQRLQLKHSAGPNTELNLTTFTGNSRGIRIDLVISSVLQDRATFPQEADATLYRLVFTEALSSSGELAGLLRPATLSHSSPLVGLSNTTRRFDPTRLWQMKAQKAEGGSLGSVLSGLPSLTEDDLHWVCDHLLVETSALEFSGDLTAPGPAEELLLDRVRDEVGAGSYPNADLTPVDVAAQLIMAAVSARTGLDDTTAATLIRRTRLRTDFGAVTAATPVTPGREVGRHMLVTDLVGKIKSRSSSGGVLVIVGPPGQGKSWVSDQVGERLEAEGWLVAEHYCFLGEADLERDDRVLLDAIFGSLIARLADRDGKLILENFPRFAADRNTLQQSLRTATRDGKRKVALVVDGLDHISRVMRTHRSSNPSLVVCEALAQLELPENVVLVVLSQPGEHLAPFTEAERSELPGMTRAELDELSNLLLGETTEGETEQGHYLDELDARSGGNALYATYLVFEASRRDVGRYPTRADLISALPPFDGTLKNYYEYLYAEMDAEGWVVAEELAVANFAMTREELEQLRNPSRVENALRVMAPVLRVQVSSGIRFYHESFGRFVRERLAEHPAEVSALLETISTWLMKRGIFEDSRAYRWLLPTLAEQERHDELVALIDDAFVETSIANAFSARAINANLARASESAAILMDWPGLVRLIQMAAAVNTYDFDRFETLVDFSDVQAAFIDPQHIADRLSDGDRLVVSGRQGLLRCAALDAAGAVAPWTDCLSAFERDDHNVRRGGADDQQVGLALLRGRLRLATPDHSVDGLKWKAIAKFVDSIGAPVSGVVDVISDVVGLEQIPALAKHSKDGTRLLIELAQRLPEYREMALERLRTTPQESTGLANIALAFGLNPTEMWPEISKLRDHLLMLTRTVIGGTSASQLDHLDRWLDSCAYAARLDPVGLATAEALVGGDGWYRCWLEFAIALVRAECEEPTLRGGLALDAIRILENETNPFKGKPRATDLYSAHETIAATITRALHLVDADQLADALDILGRVSNFTTTIGMGFQGGPLLPEVLASIAENVSPENGRSILRSHLLKAVADVGADVMYPEVAVYHLRLARLELRDGAKDAAAEHWNRALSLLTAYGSHKDPTVYELTEPLEGLIEIDLSAVREFIQRLQPITLAVEHHTDGRGTSRTHADWWKEVARADPTWLIDLALPELADHVNSSHWALHRAVEEVWTFHHGKADPRISAAVRVAVETPLIDADPADLSRYLESKLFDEPGGPDLLRAILARFDERATTSVYTNGQQILDASERLVGRANDAVAGTPLPRVSKVRPQLPAKNKDDRWGMESRYQSEAMIVDWSRSQPSAPGLPGVYEIIQTIRHRRRDSDGSGLGPDGFENALGFRLLELDETGRGGDAEQAVFELADALPFGESPVLLTYLCEGFQRYGRARLAATTGVLVWTRTRQRGGWGAFGAEANLEYLAGAFAVDATVASEVLGREAARTAITSDSSGISQALIQAAKAGALPWSDGPRDAAIQCWSAACDVIDRRTPRFPPSDVPEFPYVPSVDVEISQAELDRCVAAVALARVCASSREGKRRALIALGDLLEFRPESIVRDLDQIVGRLSDPITQHAVLSAALAISGVPDKLQRGLAETAGSELLDIRSVARGHLEVLPELPASSPPPELLAALRDADSYPTPSREAQELVGQFLAHRIAETEWLMPELADAILARLSDKNISAAIKKRVTSQLEASASRSRLRWPDAILSHEEEAERQFQSLAGSARMARIVVGDPIPDPANWERLVGMSLEPDAQTALAIEAVRIPRPDIQAAPDPSDPGWGDDVYGERNTIRSNGDLADLKIDGWICLGLIERREYESVRPDKGSRTSLTIAGVHAGEPDFGNIPLAAGSIRWWQDSGRGGLLSPEPFPLVAMTEDGPGPNGLGAPRFILAPTPALRGALDLRAADPEFAMADGSGEVAARLVVWRAEYEVSDYELTYPRIQGQALLVRPDRMAKLAESMPFDLTSVMIRTLFAQNDADIEPDE